MSDEPPTKKAKESPTGWENHTLNISEAVMKEDESKHFAEIAEMPVSALQGIGPKSAAVIESLKCKTVRDLGTYKYFLLARSLKCLSETETSGTNGSHGRYEGATINVDKAVDKEYETKTLKEIVEAPISALEGLTESADKLLGDLGVKTIGDLADFKYCRWAESICLLGDKYEHTMTESERKAEAALKRLS